MRVESYIEPSSQMPYYAPAFLGIERYELGQFTQKQKEWFRRRDTDPFTGLIRCQFQGFNGKGGWVQCPMDESKLGKVGMLHAHHIIPAGWYRTHWKGLSDDPHEATENFPENGILLCGLIHHNGPKGIHPDYAQALYQYRKGNKDAFKEVALLHGEFEEAGVPYWDQKWDDILSKIAQERTETYLTLHPEDPFPYK